MTEDFDRWDSFWTGYMVWVLRIVCYFTNFLFFDPLQRISDSYSVPPLVFDTGLLAYSILILAIIERVIQKRFNPKYEHLSMTQEDLSYRVEKERLLLSCFSFSGINFTVGVTIGFMIDAQEIKYPVIGLFAIIGSVMLVFIGVVTLVGRNIDTNKRMPMLFPVGITALMLPTIFILYMVKIVFF